MNSPDDNAAIISASVARILLDSEMSLVDASRPNMVHPSRYPVSSHTIAAGQVRGYGCQGLPTRGVSVGPTFDARPLEGLNSGKARTAKMSPEERSESARKAAKARWDKKKQEEESS